MANLPHWGKKRQGAWVGRKEYRDEDDLNEEESRRLLRKLTEQAGLDPDSFKGVLYQIAIPLVTILIILAIVFAIASFATHHYAVGMGIVVPMVVLTVFLIKQGRR